VKKLNKFAWFPIICFYICKFIHKFPNSNIALVEIFFGKTMYVIHPQKLKPTETPTDEKKKYSK